MKKISNKHTRIPIILVLTFIFVLIVIPIPIVNAEEKNVDTDVIERGRVISIIRNIPEPTDEYSFPGQVVQIEITSGEYKGQVVDAYNIFSGNPRYDIHVKPGQRVILTLDEENGELVAANLNDVARDIPLLILSILFVLILLLVGGKKGFKSLISLVFTIVIILKVLLPLILKGYSPMWLTIILSTLITACTIIMISGWNRKSLAAILGIVGGTTFAGILAFLFGRFALLTGLGSHEAQMLGFIRDYELDFQGILFASMLFGALGAVMDVGMSIASSIEEVYLANPIATSRELFDSGMNVGRDIMGTMSNTLILAYAGGSLPLLLILVGYQQSLLKVINLDLMASEIIRALAGSLGLFIAIPLTALFSSWLIHKKTMRKYYT
ncbi:MAG: YibE/F family protein [Halanaerobiales bacterium]|nr:YibE/F family protein [Halanaerobiales bacterium]